MGYIVLKRDSNDFSDVLSDIGIKKQIRTKIQFTNHLILELTEDNDVYIILKYGDDIIKMTEISADRSPIPGKDYIPEKKKRNK